MAIDTANYGLTKPQVGANSGDWGNILNSDLDKIDTILNNLQKLIDTKTDAAVAIARDAAHPVETIYWQLPGKKSPKELRLGGDKAVWQIISSQFAKSFFRVEETTMQGSDLPTGIQPFKTNLDGIIVQPHKSIEENNKTRDVLSDSIKATIAEHYHNVYLPRHKHNIYHSTCNTPIYKNTPDRLLTSSIEKYSDWDSNNGGRLTDYLGQTMRKPAIPTGFDFYSDNQDEIKAANSLDSNPEASFSNTKVITSEKADPPLDVKLTWNMTHKFLYADNNKPDETCPVHQFIRIWERVS